MHYIEKTPKSVSNINVTLKKSKLTIQYDRARESYLDVAEVDLDRVAENMIIRTSVRL